MVVQMTIIQIHISVYGIMKVCMIMNWPQCLEPFTSKFVNVNVVLGQCFSGGFNDNLKKVGCVVASASTGSESSFACSDIPS